MADSPNTIAGRAQAVAMQPDLIAAQRSANFSGVFTHNPYAPHILPPSPSTGTPSPSKAHHVELCQCATCLSYIAQQRGGQPLPFVPQVNTTQPIAPYAVQQLQTYSEGGYDSYADAPSMSATTAPDVRASPPPPLQPQGTGQYQPPAPLQPQQAGYGGQPQDGMQMPIQAPVDQQQYQHPQQQPQQYAPAPQQQPQQAQYDRSASPDGSDLNSYHSGHPGYAQGPPSVVSSAYSGHPGNAPGTAPPSEMSHHTGYHGGPPSATGTAPPLMSAPAPPQPPQQLPAVRYATVNFKFGSRTYLAPFHVTAGDGVVVEWDDSTEHIGMVAETFAAAPNGEEPCVGLLRHSRQQDIEEFNKSSFCERPALDEAQRLINALVAAGQVAPESCTMRDCEWQLDKTGVTFLVGFSGSLEDLDKVHNAFLERFECNVWLLTAAVATDHLRIQKGQY